MEKRVSISPKSGAECLGVCVPARAGEGPWRKGLNAARARHTRRLPVGLTVKEVHAFFDQLPDIYRSMVTVVYRCGLRLTECVSLRIENVNLERGLVIVRTGKGDKDRRTVLPDIRKDPLVAHLAQVRELYDRDQRAGLNGASFLNALERKYPHAGKEWA